MEHMDHMPFIVGSYTAAAVVIAALIGWVALDFRAQRRALAELETRGVTRRSSGAARRPKEQAKEQAEKQANEQANEQAMEQAGEQA
jgi:heme exporter protein D